MPTKSNNAYLTVLRIYPMDSTEDRLNGKEKLMTARGLPLMVYDAKKVLKAMKGEDFIGIVPRGDFPYYCSQYFSDHDVLDCVSFEDEMLEKFGDKIEWYEVDTFYPVKE